MRGYFITVEGGEGCGKSTLVKHLQKELEALGKRVVVTREPGGTPGAEEIRLLLTKEQVGRWDPVTEMLLLMASRRDLLTHLIKPKLAEGTWVICDRFYDSTLVYQGYCGGVDEAWIQDTYRIISDGLYPDLTLLLDLDPKVGIARTEARFQTNINKEGRWYEDKELAFHERVRAGYLDLAQKNGDRYVTFDAAGAPEQINATVLEYIKKRLLSQ